MISGEIIDKANPIWANVPSHLDGERYISGDTATGWMTQPAVLPEPSARELKRIGVEFEGVMCSATKEDMWGLKSIESYVAAGQDTPFQFDNGNTLILTQSNMADFQAVWIPFRASFF